jgi:hypothetical protein
MMALIIFIIGMAWLANLLVWKFDAEWFIKLKNNYVPKNRLFTCTECFAFWFSIPPTFLLFASSILFTLLIALVISVTAAIMEKNLNLFN